VDDNIVIDLKETGFEGVTRIYLPHDKNQWLGSVSMKGGQFID
jgi:hypothetical protein